MYNITRFEWHADKNQSNQKLYREGKSNGDKVIRILSAREADPRERRIYLEQAPH
jgi:uncharacterized DUF497 family protein